MWEPGQLLQVLRDVFKRDTIVPAYIWKQAPLGRQGAHQDDKHWAKFVETATLQQLYDKAVTEWHWAGFGALYPGQFIQVACEGNPDQLTSYPLQPGSLTMLLTNTWHAGDSHRSELHSINLFLDFDGQPARTDIQRYWDINNHHISPAERENVVKLSGPVEIVEVNL